MTMVSRFHTVQCAFCGREDARVKVVGILVGERCYARLTAIARANDRLDSLAEWTGSADRVRSTGRPASPDSRDAQRRARRNEVRTLTCRTCLALFAAPAVGRAPVTCDGCTSTLAMQKRRRHRARLGFTPARVG